MVTNSRNMSDKGYLLTMTTSQTTTHSYSAVWRWHSFPVSFWSPTRTSRLALSTRKQAAGNWNPQAIWIWHFCGVHSLLRPHVALPSSPTPFLTDFAFSVLLWINNTEHVSLTGTTERTKAIARQNKWHITRNKSSVQINCFSNPKGPNDGASVKSQTNMRIGQQVCGTNTQRLLK